MQPTTSTISSRRQIITVVLLLLALGGGVLRWLAPQPSLARDMGSLLLVLWLPIIGNIIAWLVARASRAGRPAQAAPGFAPGAEFAASGRVLLTLFAAAVPSESRPVRSGLFPCMVVVGSDAFSARLSVPPGAEPVPEVPQALEIEFLRPALALASLRTDAVFSLLSGRTLLGQGRLMSPGDDAPGALR